MNKKQVADMLHCEFESLMKSAYRDIPRGGMQWTEQWKTFLAGAMSAMTVAYHDPESILVMGDVITELAKQIVQPGRRN